MNGMFVNKKIDILQVSRLHRLKSDEIWHFYIGHRIACFFNAIYHHGNHLTC
jgi:predicted cupin superfamily sugar epimerase